VSAQLKLMLSSGQFHDMDAVTSRRGLESPDKLWCAIKVRPRWEKSVSQILREKNYDEFLPWYQKRQKWSDRVKELTLPLIPGYVFCRSNLGGCAPVVTTPGVVGLLRFGNALAVVSDEEISSLRQVIASKVGAMPWPYLNRGERVCVTCGPLNGLEGIFVQTKRDSRIVISVDALCRSVAVEVDRDWVAPLKPSRSAA
jgi:transcription antitermination factor NusG